nr:MAG TPA: hypothetical protein [Caudoviricetes sp.]
MTGSIVNDQYWITIPDRGLCLIKLDHFYKWIQKKNYEKKCNDFR